MNQMKRKRGLVSTLMAEMYVWMCVGTDLSVEDVAYSAEQISQMYATGDAPWDATGVGTRLYFGKLYHRLTSDRARCQEELQILPVEKRRLRTWLDKMIMAVELSLSECITLELDVR